MRFHIHAYGDATVGDGSHYATVDIPYAVEDKEYVESCRETLTDAFKKIFDNNRVRVQTDEEYRAEQ